MKSYYSRDGITIYNQDCREAVSAMPSQSVDLVVTSPPYNCNAAYLCHDDSMPISAYWDFIESVYHCCASVMKSGGYSCWNVPNWIGSRKERVFAPDEYRPIFDRHLQFLDWIIWDKSPARGAAWGNYPNAPRIRAEHENIFIHRAAGKPIGNSDISWADWSRFTTSIWKVPVTLPFNSLHPATFPQEIPRRLALLYSVPKGVVLDPFGGSGTTAAACWILDRQCVLCEINEEYCEIAARRIDRMISEGKASNP